MTLRLLVPFTILWCFYLTERSAPIAKSLQSINYDSSLLYRTWKLDMATKLVGFMGGMDKVENIKFSKDSLTQQGVDVNNRKYSGTTAYKLLGNRIFLKDAKGNEVKSFYYKIDKVTDEELVLIVVGVFESEPRLSPEKALFELVFAPID